jgi:hypothetical protein
VGALIALCVALGRWALALVAAARSTAGRYDFSSYYAAATALRTNPHANIYDAHVLDSTGAAAHVLVNPPLPYTYPPLFAILLSPFTVISFRTLSRVWLFGNAALWLGITTLLALEIRHLLGGSVGDPAVDGIRGWRQLTKDPTLAVSLALATWLSLTFAPAAQTLATGQINFVVLLPLAVIPWLTRHGHERWVGGTIAVAAMLKLTPALLIVYLLLRRRWRAAGAAVVTIAVLTAVCVLIVGPGVTLASLGQALSVGAGDAGLGHNEALFAPILTALGASSTSGLALLVARGLTAALALALGYWLWRRPAVDFTDNEDRERAESAGYGVALCALLLLAPTAWVHHYVWVLPAAAIALGLALRRALASTAIGSGVGAWITLAVVVLACVVLGWSLPNGWDTTPHPVVTTFAGLPLWPLLLGLRPLGALALAGVLAWWYAHPVGARTSYRTSERA